MRASNGRGGCDARDWISAMSKDQMLAAIRRGLKRGALPEDQAMALRARMAAHPRHLVPARSRVARPAQVALFIANVEKEFGSVARVASLAEVPAAVAESARLRALQFEQALTAQTYRGERLHERTAAC